MKPYPIVFIDTGESGGGSFLSLYTLLQAIDRSKFSPVVVLTANLPQWKKRYESLGVPVYRIQSPVHSPDEPADSRSAKRRLENLCRFFPGAYPAVIKGIWKKVFPVLDAIVREHAIVAVYDNNQCNRNLFCSVLASRWNIPLISHLRSSPQNDFFSFKARRANRTIVCFIANSKATARTWLAKGLEPSKCVVIHNALAPQSVPEKMTRKELGFNEGHIVLASTARFVGYKRLDLPLRALQLLRARFPNLRLVLAGDGVERAKLENLAEELGVADLVHFTGWLDDAVRIWTVADIAIISSEGEPFGLSVLESQSMGVPTIGADAGGVPEIIDHEQTGLLFSSGNAEDLARCIERFIVDTNLRDACVRNAKAMVNERFSPNRFAGQIEEILTTILCRNTGNVDEHRTAGS